MYELNIYEELETREDFIYVLEEIKSQIEQGNTSGVNPSWDFKEVEE